MTSSITETYSYSLRKDSPHGALAPFMGEDSGQKLSAAVVTLCSGRSCINDEDQ